MDRWAKMVRGLALLAAGCGAAGCGTAGAQGLIGPPIAQLAPGRELASRTALAGVQAVLRTFSDQAGVIFTGTVVAIRMGQTDGIGFASGAVEVDFRVEAAVRGCAPGLYTLREWGGLWGAAGEPRYRVGQRALVFLHAPGASGLSSPVAGMDGVVPMMGSGVAPGPLDTSAAAGAMMVDLRWLQTHLTPAPSYAGPVHPIEHMAAVGLAGSMPAVEEQTPASAERSVTMTSAAALTLLRGWEEERHEAR